MAALDLSPPPSLIPVIIISEKADALKIIYITTSIESDHKSGETVMQELKSHLISRKLTRLGMKCRLKHWIVSRTTLIATDHGPELGTPIEDALLTQALKKPAFPRSTDAGYLVGQGKVLVIESGPNKDARALAARILRIAVRAGIVAVSVLSIVGV